MASQMRLLPRMLPPPPPIRPNYDEWRQQINSHRECHKTKKEPTREIKNAEIEYEYQVTENYIGEFAYFTYHSSILHRQKKTQQEKIQLLYKSHIIP